MFKISQDITDSNDLYLHIRNKIITLVHNPKQKELHLHTRMHTIKLKMEAVQSQSSRNLKSGELYKIDFNGNGFPEGVIPTNCTFIAGVHQSSFTSTSLIKETKPLDPRGQHIGIVLTSEGREPSQEEAHKIYTSSRTVSTKSMR